MKQMRGRAVCFVAVGVALHITGCEALTTAAQESSAGFAEAPITRARVVAELEEAQRLGLITVGEGDVPQLSSEQVQLIAQAGERADAVTALAKK